MQGTSIHPSLFEAMLNSAPNAERKGQAQYFTPLKWARLLALPLPTHRPCAVDLTCGGGHLLKALDAGLTEHKLGCDIDGDALPGTVSTNYVAADLADFVPLLRDVQFAADLFVLNPPWDLHWHRERFAWLKQAELPTVQMAFTAHDGRTSKSTIDSSIVTLCCALELGSEMSEGYILLNSATADRLILAEGAPHESLRCHIWAVAKLPAKTAAPVASTVLYFARDHFSGIQIDEECATADEAESLLTRIKHKRDWREGKEAAPYLWTKDTQPAWEAAVLEHRRLHSVNHAVPKFNLWLDAGGLIGTHVSLYDERVGTVNKDEAALLHSLKGKRPMQLVVQRAQRDALMRAVRQDSPWRVHPDLAAAVAEAVREYHGARAPLYPLPAIQRLGYLDESDTIKCIKPLGTQFIPGHSYPIRTQTLAVRRPSKRVNLNGAEEALELTGQELAIFITGETGERLCFMEARLVADGVRIEKLDAALTPKTDRYGEAKVVKKEDKPADDFLAADDVAQFTLQLLVECFEIPEVPDVAALNPEGYERNLQLLDQIERLAS